MIDKRKSTPINIWVVCALHIEAQAFLKVCSHASFQERTSPKYGYDYRFTTTSNAKGDQLALHISWLPRYGPQEMALHLEHIVEEFHPRMVLMTGICAGDKQHVHLGDLIVAERTFTYDNGKYEIDEYRRRVHLHDAITYQLDLNILGYLQMFTDWEMPVARLERPPSMPQQYKVHCHFKPMASGSAVRSDNPFKDVQVPVRQAWAIDMEGAAFSRVLSGRPEIQWLIVKGVSDYADQEKDDSYHGYAARVSAIYALCFILAYVTNERLLREQQEPSEPEQTPILMHEASIANTTKQPSRLTQPQPPPQTTGQSFTRRVFIAGGLAAGGLVAVTGLGALVMQALSASSSGTKTPSDIVCTGHTGRVIGLGATPDSKRIISGGAWNSDISIRSWDTSTGESKWTNLTASDSWIYELDCSYDGKYVLAAIDTNPHMYNGAILVLDAQTGKLLRYYNEPSKKKVDRVRWFDATHFVSNDSGAALFWIDNNQNKNSNLATYAQTLISDISVCPQRKTVFLGALDGTVKEWDPIGNRITAVYGTGKNLGSVQAVRCSPNAQYLAIASSDAHIYIWDIAKDQWISTYSGNQKAVYHLAWAPDSKFVALSGDEGLVPPPNNDRTVHIFGVDGKQRFVYRGHSQDVCNLLWLSNERIASCGWDATVRIWPVP